MKKKGIIILIISLVIIILGIVGSILYINYQKEQERLEQQRKLEYIESIKNSYNKYVITTKETNLYNSNKEIIGKINSDVKISLKEKEIDDINDDYFELELFDNHYVFFEDVKSIENLDEKDSYYKNYIVFNENCVTENKTTFYDKNFNYLYEINNSVNLPIYIKEDEYYGVEFNDELVYLKKDEVKVENSNNTEEKNAKDIPVLLYHFFHTHNRYENWTSVISLRTDKFEDQLKYLTDNNFMTLKMRDLELYVEGKVQIRENSVVLTIDDGNETIFSLAYPIIEKYGVNVTVFAVTAWSPEIINQQTNFVEMHSHTHDMHITGRCKGGQGGLFKCVDYNVGLADLKQSRELLNNTTYLAYPFGEYTDLSINLLKEAGYTMALTTNYGNAKVGNDKYLIPRIYIYNQYTLQTFKRIVN